MYDVCHASRGEGVCTFVMIYDALNTHFGLTGRGGVNYGSKLCDIIHECPLTLIFVSVPEESPATGTSRRRDKNGPETSLQQKEDRQRGLQGNPEEMCSQGKSLHQKNKNLHCQDNCFACIKVLFTYPYTVGI